MRDVLTNERIVIDLGSADVLSDAEVRAWASDQRVFVSSVMGGMEAVREAVAAAIEDVGAAPVLFERLGGRDDDAETAFLTGVDSSDIYVGVLGERYGRMQPDGYSPTHAEYREALARGLRICVWAWTGELAGPQRDFLDEVQVFRTTGSYTDPSDLRASVAERLRGLAAEAVSPWVKVGAAIFRARRVGHDGKEVQITARIRDDEVIAYLESLRPGGMWSGKHSVDVTWSGRNEFVEITAVETETTAGRGRAVTVKARHTERESMRRPAFVDVALAGRSPEDLTELAVRIAVLGEPNPLGPMAFMAAMDNPFDVIDGLRLPEDAVQPIAYLLLTEALVGSSRADRLTALHVGPKQLGARRIMLRWLPRRRYTNVVPEERRVEGEVRSS
jgi:hypothetical protein